MLLHDLLKTTVFQKQIVAVSGLLLSGFVLVHMSGNLLILISAESYNHYSHALISNPFLEVAEMGLALVFILHVLFAISLTRRNRESRSERPYVAHVKVARFGSRSMILTGLLTIAFLILHLKTFKYGAYYEVEYGGVAMRDLHRLVIEKFREPFYSAFYVFSMVLLGIHLCHGFASVFQSLGVSSVRKRWVRNLGYTLAVVVSVGFAIQPLYVLAGRP